MFPNSFELLINATYKGGAAFRKAEGDAKDLGDAAEKSGKRTGDAFRQIGLAAGVAGAAFGALVFAGKKAWDTLNDGAALVAAQGRFENLSESIGTTADSMLGKLREATSGMMSDAALMASATDLMSLGLGKTEESVVRLATVVGTLGWDMQQVVLTMANNSKMRLDALGLSVEDVDARVAKLRESGMSLDEAFDLAVIEAGEAKILLLGDAADTTEGKIKILTAQLKNAGDAFKAAFAEELASGIDEAAESAGAMGENMVYAAEGAAHLVAQLAKLPMGFLVDMGKEARIDELRAQFIALGGDIEEVNKQIMAMPLKDTTFDDIANRNIELLAAGIAALEDATRRASPELKYLEGWKGVSAGTTEDATVALSEWTDEAKKAAIAAGELADFNIEGVTGANQSGIWAAAGAHIQSILDEAEAAAQETADEIAQELADAFAEASARASGYFTDAMEGLQDWKIPDLVTPERDVSFVISGPTSDQLGLMEEYKDRYDAAASSVRDLQAGLGTYGIEQDKVNEKIAAAQGEMAHYQALMDGLALPVTEMGTAHQSLAFNMDMVQDAIYGAGAASGATAGQIGELGVALGQFTPEMAEAALKTAIFYGALDKLTQEWKMGTLDTSEFIAAVQGVVTDLENNTVVDLQYNLEQKADGFIEPQRVPVEPDWVGGDPVAMTGSPIKIPVEYTVADGAISQAMTEAGIPAEGMTEEVVFTAEYEAVTTAVTTIQEKVDAIDGVVEFEPEYAVVTEAVGTIQTDIDAIDGQVEFKPESRLVREEIAAIDGSHVTVFVDFVPVGSPSGAGGGGGGGGNDGRSGRGGGFKVDMNVNFNGKVDDPRRVTSSIRTGLEEFYADIRREGVSW